ncbi:MAG: hypothetical protein WCO28_11610, partial [Bacteroidota bacterium]
MKKILLITVSFIVINVNAQNVGIGTTTPQAKLSIGASSQFQVDSVGNIKKVNNIPYSFPSTQGSNGQVLSNNGSGTLSWISFPATLTTLNGLSGATQTFATGTSGTDFSISSSGTTHTFNIPNASSSSRGLVSSSDWNTFNNKLNRTGTDTMSGNLVVTNPLVVATPTANNNAATKLYVDNATSSQVTTSRTVSTTAPLTGGGALSSNLTIAIPQANATTNGYISSTDWSAHNNKLNRTGADTMSGNLVVTNPLVVATPTANNNATTKLYVDNASANKWGTSGNAGTNSSINFIGTTDTAALAFRVNNQKAGRIDPTLNNTFFGYQTGVTNTTGTNNTVVGYQSLYSNTTGSINIANGGQALYNNTTGGANVAIGPTALYSNTTGWYNIANGYTALYYNTTGSDNIASGPNALYSNTTGSINTAYGESSLSLNTTGNNNSATGVLSLQSNTIGSYNTAMGRNALNSNT